LLEREREYMLMHEPGEWPREREVDSLLSRKPDTGLNPRTPGS